MKATSSAKRTTTDKPTNQYAKVSFMEEKLNLVIETLRTSATRVYTKIHKKIYVNIPFQYNDTIKKLGGRWDIKKKSWYYLSNLEKNKIDAIKKLAF